MQNKKLHICIVTGEFPALTETFITTKVLELHHRGHKITVIKNQHSGNINASHLSLVKDAGIEILSFTDVSSVSNVIKAAFNKPALFIQSLSANPASFKKNYKAKRQAFLLQEHNYDIIHFEFSGLAVAYIDALKNIKAKTVVSCRGTAEKVKTISEPGRIQKLTNVFSAINSIHCVSQDMANTIKPYCNNDKKIFINRPSIDAEIFKRTKPYSDANPIVHILSIGRFTFQKGYLSGLLAARELKDAGLQFKWTIVGDGQQLEEIQYHIHALALQDLVVLAGKKNRNEIIELYNTADIYFLPSFYEGIANVSLEAMSMELPVIATKSGGMEEVIEPGEDGLLAATYDHREMAKQILSISYDFDKRKKMGENARKKVLQQFTLQRQADVFEEQYYKLINND